MPLEPIERLAITHLTALAEKHGVVAAGQAAALIGGLAAIGAQIAEKTGDANKADEFLKDVARIIDETVKCE